MADAVVRVDAVTAERRGIDILAGHLGDHAGTGQEHARVLGHDHEIRQCRGIGAAAGRRATDHRYLRHQTRQLDVLAEDIGGGRERGEALLHARPGRLDEPDHGHSRALGQLEHRHDRLRMRLAERAAGERSVLGEDGNRPAVDAPAGAEHAIAGPRLLAHPAGHHLGAQQVEAEPGSQRTSRRSSAVRRSSGRGTRARVPCCLQTEHGVVAPQKPKELEIAIARCRPSGRSSGPRVQRHVVEVQLGVGLVETERWRQHARAQREDRRDGFDGAGRTEQVADRKPTSSRRPGSFPHAGPGRAFSASSISARSLSGVRSAVSVDM